MDEITKDSVAIARLEERMRRMEDDMTEMSGKLDTVLTALSEAKGGWRTLMLLGGAGAAAGGLVTWIATHITLKGTP
jgi:hypothetical protein